MLSNDNNIRVIIQIMRQMEMMTDSKLCCVYITLRYKFLSNRTKSVRCVCVCVLTTIELLQNKNLHLKIFKILTNENFVHSNAHNNNFKIERGRDKTSLLLLKYEFFCSFFSNTF